MRGVGDGASPSTSVPDATCGPLDDLWGSRALAHTTRDAVTPLANESHLLRCLRKKVGPFADAECLRQHLRAARGKLHWSANGYFREAVTATVIPPRVGRARRDFEPRPLARDPLRDDREADETKPSFALKKEKEKEAPSLSLPPLAWERVLSRVSLADACRLARVAPAAREAAGSETVWRAQYAARWGARAAASLETRAAARRDAREARETGETVFVEPPPPPPPPTNAAFDSFPSLIRWRDEYRARHARDADMTCPECLTSKVTPIVYGFPSPALVAAMRGGVVALGGDYLVEGDPNWACKACQSRWRAWPFAWPDDALAAADERRLARVSSRPGLAGAGHGGGGGRGGGNLQRHDGHEGFDGFAFGDLDSATATTAPFARDDAAAAARTRS